MLLFEFAPLKEGPAGPRRPSPARSRAADSTQSLIQKRYVTGFRRAMKRGPKPSGTAMTAAERQARFRAAHADGSPRLRYRRPADRRSIARKWRDAVSELVDLQEGYRTWLDSLPENLAESATAEALRAICDLELSELDSVEPPRGRRWPSTSSKRSRPAK